MTEAVSGHVGGRLPPYASLLSDTGILRHMKAGSIVIEPFSRESLSTSSYDVTLGRYFFRETRPEPGQGIYNPFSSSHVEKVEWNSFYSFVFFLLSDEEVWGSVMAAERAGDWSARNRINLENIGGSLPHL